MVSPKHKALKIENKQEVINCYNNLSALNPNKKSVLFLIDKFNEVHGSPLMDINSFNSCNDCRLALKNFFKWIILEWERTS